MSHQRPATKLFDMTKGFAPITNVLGVGDPDVHKVGNQWWMFLGGYQSIGKVNLFHASLPPGAPLSSNAWSLTTSESDPSTALALIAQPDEASWDAWLHTPSYVQGIDPHASGGPALCERIYYTGSHGTNPTERQHAVGLLERTPTGWVRHGEPVLTGRSDSPNLLEPKVRYFDHKWRLWAMTTAKVDPETELPHYQIVYLESNDGVSGWTSPQTLFTTADNYYDSVIVEAQAGYEMVVARAPNLYATPGFPAQGLWWLSSSVPSGKRSDWTREPVRLLDADHGAGWYASGVYGPSMRYGDTPQDSDVLYVFFTGVSHPAGPPFPAPYFLTVGRTEVERASLVASANRSPVTQQS